jgi:hypothetical protein
MLLIGSEEYLGSIEFMSTHVDPFCVRGNVPNLEVPSPRDSGQKSSVGAESYAGGSMLLNIDAWLAVRPQGKAEELLSGLDAADINVGAGSGVRAGYCQEQPIRAERNTGNYLPDL